MTTKILIIDDSSKFRETLALYLKKELSAIEIVEASTGEIGVDLAINESFDVILMDLQLPQMDGIAAAEKIKKTLPHSVIILLSLFAGDMLKQNNVSKAIDEVVGKNGIETRLMPLLHKYLHT
ncbi:response regulator transcription factor [Candidatus Omnitrophota bacterium]